MTVRDELRKQRQIANDLKNGTEAEETVSAESMAAIREGMEDIKAGRTVSWEQVKSENAI